MRKMITLRGEGGCGKTQKIKEIAQVFFNKYEDENEAVNLKKGDIAVVLKAGDFKIGFVSGGDSVNQIKKVDVLLDNHEDIEVIINACRINVKVHTTYIENNYNVNNGWSHRFIDVERFDISEKEEQINRDNVILEHLKSFLFDTYGK